MVPWVLVARATAPDGTTLELRRRGDEVRIRAGAHELMSSEDEASSRALADVGCAHLERAAPARVLVGGLGLGFTLRAALDRLGPAATVEVAELVPEVAAWNRGELGPLAGHPLDDPRAVLRLEDVARVVAGAKRHYDAILLDVDNGPIALAHAANDHLYGRAGLDAAWRALRPGGVLAVWSLSGDEAFVRRMARRGFAARAVTVEGSRRGRGRRHVVFVGRRPGGEAA